MPEAELRTLAAGLAEALQAIHRAGLVHRDLKPSNVLVTGDGPRVIDFGISKALEGVTRMTGTGLVVGTPGFMSPEQATGADVGPESDIFSLGAVLTFAGTGGGPFGEGSVPALLYRVVHDAPRLDGLPAGTRPLVERCLEKEPGRRPGPEEVLDMLGQGAASGPERGATAPATTPVAAPVADPVPPLGRVEVRKQFTSVWEWSYGGGVILFGLLGGALSLVFSLSAQMPAVGLVGSLLSIVVVARGVRMAWKQPERQSVVGVDAAGVSLARLQWTWAGRWEDIDSITMEHRPWHTEEGGHHYLVAVTLRAGRPGNRAPRIRGNPSAVGSTLQFSDRMEARKELAALDSALLHHSDRRYRRSQTVARLLGVQDLSG